MATEHNDMILKDHVAYVQNYYKMVKVRTLRKSDHWKRKDDSVVLAAIEGEVEGRR